MRIRSPEKRLLGSVSNGEIENEGGAELTSVIGDDFLSRQRVLVIAPHADDESYGCAGTIARIKELGGQVYVILMSVGSIVQYTDTDRGVCQAMVAGDTRLREFTQAMDLLKVDDWEVIYSDDSLHLALDTIPRRQLVQVIEQDARLSIQNVGPTMLMIPAMSYNQDHEVLYRACMTACRPGAPNQRHMIPYVLAYDNTSLFWAPERERFHPDFYVDVTDFLSIKLQAIRLHASQMRDPLFHGSAESLDLMTRVRGREISVESAEGFKTVRAVF